MLCEFGGCRNGNVVIFFKLIEIICRMIVVRFVCRILGLVKVGCFLKFFFV